jgi:hypothetical protein
MTLELKISYDESAESAKRLAAILGVEGSDLSARLEQVAGAALEEYELAFSGVRAPSTVRELRELRLRLLYEHLPEGEPTDDQIAELFQMTRPQVGTLIAGTRARFGPQLDQRLRHAAIGALQGASNVDDDTARIVVPDSLARYVRDLVAQTSAPPPDKRRDASRTYDLGRDTVRALCRKLGIEPSSVTALTWDS